MSNYDNISASSDLDTYKHTGVRTASLTISGTIPSAGELNFSTGLIPVDNPDYGKFLFDHGDLHANKYRDLSMDRIVFIYNNTTSLYDVVAMLFVEVSGTGATIRARVINPYGSSTSLRSTTLNFRYVPFEATI